MRQVPKPLQIPREGSQLLILYGCLRPHRRPHAHVDAFLVYINAATAAIYWLHVVLMPPLDGTLLTDLDNPYSPPAAGRQSLLPKENGAGHIHPRACKHQFRTGLRFAGRHTRCPALAPFSSRHCAPRARNPVHPGPRQIISPLSKRLRAGDRSNTMTLW